jgi:hypothetical protein
LESNDFSLFPVDRWVIAIRLKADNQLKLTTFASASMVKRPVPQRTRRQIIDRLHDGWVLEGDIDNEDPFVFIYPPTHGSATLPFRRFRSIWFAYWRAPATLFPHREQRPGNGSFLAERFKLAVHYDVQSASGYAGGFEGRTTTALRERRRERKYFWNSRKDRGAIVRGADRSDDYG